MYVNIILSPPYTFPHFHTRQYKKEEEHFRLYGYILSLKRNKNKTKTKSNKKTEKKNIKVFFVSLINS